MKYEDVLQELENLPLRTLNREVKNIMKASGRESIALADKIAYIAMGEEGIFSHKEVVDILDKLERTRLPLGEWLNRQKEATA